MRNYTIEELKEIAKYQYPVIRDEKGNLLSNRFNWKQSLDKWRAGIHMRLAELENLSAEMECSFDEKFWIDAEIKHRKENWQLF